MIGDHESQKPRSGYLLDGRRVTIADLLDAGMLAAGDVLQFKRPRRGETHHAVVTPSGGLELDGGQIFGSPSRAAIVAADMTAVDGWHAWKTMTSGRSLDALRQQLLDQAATATADGSTGMQRRYEWLRDARARADADKPLEMTVRELLARWDTDADGPTLYQRIDADLANHGLTTSPSHRKVSLDTKVRLITPEQDAEATGHVPPDAREGELDVGLTVGNLPSALSGVVSVRPDDTFEKAITLMMLNGYSQLAVMAGTHTLRGAITWQSIACTRHANPAATLAHAIIPAREARYDQALVEVLPDLEAYEFVFVRDEKNAVAGIVTTSDVVGTYRDLSTPFLLIGELDQVLQRQLISRTFTLVDITACCDADGSRSISSFDDLDMGDYQRVLENPQHWAKLGWPLDRPTFIKRLDELRVIRNNVMHFNPEPLPANAVDRLRNILKLLRDFGTLTGM